MTIREALDILEAAPDPGAPVIVLQSAEGELAAAPVLAVALDEDGGDASLLVGEFDAEDDPLDDAVTVAEVRDALRETGDEHGDWPLYFADLDDLESGDSIVGHSADDEVGMFAFLAGPRSAWEPA